MRPSVRLVIAAALMAVCSGASVAAPPDQPDADAILQQLDDLYRSKSSIARIQIDVTSTRSTRSMRLRAYDRKSRLARTMYFDDVKVLGGRRLEEQSHEHGSVERVAPRPRRGAHRQQQR